MATLLHLGLGATAGYLLAWLLPWAGRFLPLGLGSSLGRSQAGALALGLAVAASALVLGGSPPSPPLLAPALLAVSVLLGTFFLGLLLARIRLPRNPVPVLLPLLILLGTGLVWREHRAEAALRADLRPAPGVELRAGRPDVLLLILEDWRFREIGSRRPGIPAMPVLTALRADSLDFPVGFTASEAGTPDPAWLLQGAGRPRGGGASALVAGPVPVLPRRLAGLGCRTAAATARYDLQRHPWFGFTFERIWSGVSSWKLRGLHGGRQFLGSALFRALAGGEALTRAGSRWLEEQAREDHQAIEAGVLSHQALALVDGLHPRTEEPLFLVVDYRQGREDRPEPGTESWRRSLERVDSAVEGLFEGLRSRGRLRRSLVLVVADRPGEEGGLPFFVQGPAFQAGVHRDPVPAADLEATLLLALGGETRPAEEGRPLQLRRPEEPPAGSGPNLLFQGR